MKLIIDEEQKTLISEDGGQIQKFNLYSNEAFELLSRQWLRIGFDRKYAYTFSWFGRPVIQLPEDLIRLQELIYQVKPDVIIETGVAHGGSLMFSTTLCKAMGKGRVIGVDIEIRLHNRRAIESHELSSYITLLEGSSTDPAIVRDVKALVSPGEVVLVILDSNHTKQHVLDELEAYCDLVTPDSYLLVADGVMKDLHDVPGGKPEWLWDSPCAAIEEFVKQHPEFTWESPKIPFSESPLNETNITYWTSGCLKRKALSEQLIHS